MRRASPLDAEAVARIHNEGVDDRRQLLAELVRSAKADGYQKLVGRLFTSNRASVALARRCGFRDVGVHLRHGRLDGVWFDVLLVERSIGGGDGCLSAPCTPSARAPGDQLP